MGLAQDVQAVTARWEEPRHGQIIPAQDQTAQGRSELHVPNQGDLQAESGQGQAENQGAVQTGRSAWPGIAGKEHGHDRVHEEKQNQERFGGSEIRGRVVFRAPQSPDAEGADKTEQVQRPPGPKPGHAEHAGVEQCVVDEQVDVVARPGGQKNRRGEAADRSQDRQPHGVLDHGQRSGRADQDQHGDQGQFHGREPEKTSCGKKGQVQNPNPPALGQEAKKPLAPA